MAVYIDNSITVIDAPNGKIPVSVMVADSVKELHAAAYYAGIPMNRYQQERHDGHYIVTDSDRVALTVFGALKISVPERNAFQWFRNRYGFTVPPKAALKRVRLMRYATVTPAAAQDAPGTSEKYEDEVM